MTFGERDREDGFIQSLAKGIAVLRAFEPGRDRLTMAEVASVCHLTRAGARRILLTLQELGYVTMDGRQFFLTSRVLELGHGYLGQSLWEKARPVLQSLATALDATSSAGVLEGYDVVYTVRVRSSRPVHLELNPGARLPAHATSMGRILLAMLPNSTINSYLKQAKFIRYTPTTVVDADAMRKKLDEAREHGWCLARGEVNEGISGVSVPVSDSSGKVLAALNVSLEHSRASPHRIKTLVVPMLRDAAAAIINTK